VLKYKLIFLTPKLIHLILESTISAYSGLVVIIICLTQNYLDPNNTITTLDVRPVGYALDPDSTSRSDFTIHQDIFPRPVFCQKTTAYETFKEIKIYSGAEVSKQQLVNDSVFPTLMKRDFLHGLGIDSYYKACLRVSVAHQEFQIHWGASKLPVYVFFQIGADWGQSLSAKRFKVTREHKKVELKLTNFERITFREGTHYATSYPPAIRDKIPFYDQGHCLDSCIDQEITMYSYCTRWHQTHSRIINMTLPLNGDLCIGKRRNKNILCRLEDFAKNATKECGNEAVNPDYPFVKKCRNLCKPSYVLDYFMLDVSNTTSFTSNDTHAVTTLILEVPDKKFTFIKELPQRTLQDLFSDIGGYLSLLVGASVITLCEFFEFIIKSVFIRKKLVTKINSRLPESVSGDDGNTPHSLV
jgi:hypothetical protein